MSVNVYCKGERHGGHMSASSAILSMKYYDDNNTLTSTFDVTFERRQTAQCCTVGSINITLKQQ